MRKTFLVMTMVIALALGTMVTALAQGQGQGSGGNAAKSLGKTTLDTAVSQWDVGDGQPNEEFVTAEVQGVEIGLRAQERFVGLLGVTGTNGDRVGVYEAPAGLSERDPGGDENNARWNYDWHVDLSGATGNFEGRTLDEYRLTLEQDFADEVFGFDPLILALGGEHVCTTSYGEDAVPSEVGETLCQGSWNPGFGNSDFEPDEEGTYNLRLVLTPETFNGPPLAVAIQVNVSE